MKNAVGREIPDEILKITGKELFQGNRYKDGVPFWKAEPIIRPVMDNQHSKLVENIHEALVKCKAHSGMTVSFHHHFREGNLIVCIAFIGASTSDDYGNLRGIGGKTDCGVLGYSHVDGDQVEYVAAITDCLVPFPNFPAHIAMTKVDYVCVVDAIDIPEKIATGAEKPTTDQRKLTMAGKSKSHEANLPLVRVSPLTSGRLASRNHTGSPLLFAV